MSENGPERAHTLILKIGADTQRDLAMALHATADSVSRGELTVGCSGSPSWGSMYSYKHDPDMTHDEYFRRIDEMLVREALTQHGDGK